MRPDMIAGVHADLLEAHLALHRDEVAEAIPALLRLVAAPPAAGPELVETRLLAGEVRMRLGHLDEAVTELNAAWVTAQAGGTELQRARCAVLLGDALAGRGDWSDADTWYRRAGALARRVEEPSLEARARLHAAVNLARRAAADDRAGEAAAARQRYGEALAAFDAVGPMLEATGAADSVRALHASERLLVVGRLGHVDEAVAGLRQLVDRLEPAAPMGLVLTTRLGLAELLVGAGRWTEAHEVCLVAIAHRPTPETRPFLDPLIRLASDIADVLGDARSCIDHLRRLLELREAAAAERAEQAARIAAAQVEREHAAATAARAHERAARQARAANGSPGAVLSRSAFEDPLTGLANRSAFDTHLDAAHAAGEALVLAVFDLDHFGLVDELFGHDVGDDVLTHLARMLRAGCRDDDLVGRLGGDRFGIVFRGADPEAALAASERICADVDRQPWDRLAPGLHVTVSVGLAEVGLTTGTDAAVAAAGEALADAKRAGRNRVVAAGDPW